MSCNTAQTQDLQGEYKAAAFLQAQQTSTIDKVFAEAQDGHGVKLISYEQFQEIKKSGEPFVLLDVLLEDSYKKGHIEGAINFPVTSINKETAEELLNMEDSIIVYCANFKCKASSHAAKVLGDLGYKVVDYKGGLNEWKEKGNELVK